LLQPGWFIGCVSAALDVGYRVALRISDVYAALGRGRIENATTVEPDSTLTVDQTIDWQVNGKLMES